MNDLVRPAMYDAWHGIVPVSAGRCAWRRSPLPTWSARSAKAATRSRETARCRRWRRARASRSSMPARMAAVMSSTYNARPLGGRGDGGRQPLVRDPRRVSRSRRLWGGERVPTLARSSAPRRVRAPAAPARRPPALRACAILFERPVAGALAAAWRRRRVCPAPPCWTCRALLPPWLHIGLLAVAVLADRRAAGARPARHCARRTTRRPTVGWSSPPGCRHRPLSVLTDRPRAAAGRRVGALWQAHVARAVAQIGRLRVGLPRPGLARRDPRALRDALVLALVAAGRIAGDGCAFPAGAAMKPTLPVAPGAAGHRAAGLDHAAGVYADWRRYS